MKTNEYPQEEIEKRLSGGESLRSIARSMNKTYQTLQYHRRKWGGRLLRKGFTSGENHASWKGGEYIDRFGYKMIRAPHRGRSNPYVAEHVLVAEKKLGRLLIKGKEVVHHINGNKTDNNPDNLYVCSRKKHRKLHTSFEAIGYILLEQGIVKFIDGEYLLCQ